MRLKPGARLTGAAQIQCAVGVLTPRSLSQVSAWEEALPRMAIGDKWEVYAPSELAYGDDGMEEGSGAVAPGEAVVYVLELVSMEGAGVPRKPPPRDAAAEAAAEAGGGAGPLRRLRAVHELRAWAEEG